MDIIAFLKSNPLARKLSENQLQILAESAQKKICKTGQLIINEGDIARTFYIVVSGMVKMFKTSPEGKEQTLFLLGPGKVFGMCAVFSDSIFPANVSAVEESVLLVFSGDAVEPIAQQDPTILFNIVFVLSLRLKESMALIESLSLKDIPQRVASFLLFSTLDKSCNKGEVLDLTISRREMSKILGSTPETLSRVLTNMAATNIIAIHGRRIHILDCEALQKLASGVSLPEIKPTIYI
jgi:CRP/FNR family transcriptional regulator